MNAQDTAMAFVDAINGKSIDGMVDLMTENHTFIDADGAEYPGRDEMRKGWLDYFAMVPDYVITVNETFVRNDTVVLIGSGSGTFIHKGEIKPENHWTVPVALRAVIEEDRVAVWQLFVNPEPMRKILDALE